MNEAPRAHRGHSGDLMWLRGYHRSGENVFSTRGGHQTHQGCFFKMPALDCVLECCVSPVKSPFLKAGENNFPSTLLSALWGPYRKKAD